jgi:hypothetical protein
MILNCRKNALMSDSQRAYPNEHVKGDNCSKRQENDLCYSHFHLVPTLSRPENTILGLLSDSIGRLNDSPPKKDDTWIAWSGNIKKHIKSAGRNSWRAFLGNHLARRPTRATASRARDGSGLRRFDQAEHGDAILRRRRLTAG